MKTSDLIIIGGVGIAAYFLLTKGAQALGAGGGAVAQEMIGGAGTIAGGVMTGIVEGTKDLGQNIIEAGLKSGEKSGQELIQWLDDAGFLRKTKQKELTLYQVPTGLFGQTVFIPVPEPGYTKLTAASIGGELVSILDGKPITAYTEQEFVAWKAKAGYSAQAAIPGGLQYPGKGTITGETLGTSASAISVKTVSTVQYPTPAAIAPRSGASNVSQASIKAAAQPDRKPPYAAVAPTPKKPTPLEDPTGINTLIGQKLGYW
jgi:hypothetical protein